MGDSPKTKAEQNNAQLPITTAEMLVMEAGQGLRGGVASTRTGSSIAERGGRTHTAERGPKGARENNLRLVLAGPEAQLRLARISHQIRREGGEMS